MIYFERFGIGRFMDEYRSYRYCKEIKETKTEVHIGDIIVNKPDQKLERKEESIFILGIHVDDCNKLVDDASEAIRNNFNEDTLN